MPRQLRIFVTAILIMVGPLTGAEAAEKWQDIRTFVEDLEGSDLQAALVLSHSEKTGAVAKAHYQLELDPIYAIGSSEKLSSMRLCPGQYVLSSRTNKLECRKSVGLFGLLGSFRPSRDLPLSVATRLMTQSTYTNTRLDDYTLYIEAVTRSPSEVTQERETDNDASFFDDWLVRYLIVGSGLLGVYFVVFSSPMRTRDLDTMRAYEQRVAREFVDQRLPAAPKTMSSAPSTLDNDIPKPSKPIRRIDLD